MNKIDNKVINFRLAIIGLGYVGLPLALAFSKKFPTIGYDINRDRISDLRNQNDTTLELSKDELNDANTLKFTSDVSEISNSNIYIITVPTPINIHKQPDLSPLVSASRMIGKVLSKGDLVIYESTVYPGATEEICIPELERISGLKYNIDFFAGYSPERINPGDKKHRLTDIVKVTSGSNAEVAQVVDELYTAIIDAGTFKASSIRVAEAAKVIENTQRDVNIALVNELAMIFSKLNLDTSEVLEAAQTKWNFMPFKPGLVGGHCIGVDPYYLTHKAQEVGYHPEIILAGRRLNDNMPNFVASQIIKQMVQKRVPFEGSKILILGLTFKENCPDLRNTKVIDLIEELRAYQIDVDVCDPWACRSEAKSLYEIDLVNLTTKNKYDAIIISVGHDQFKKFGITALRNLGKPHLTIYDLKETFSKDEVDLRF